MRNTVIYFAFLFSFSLFACNNSSSNNGNGIPEIIFAETEFDFGSIKAGEKVSHRFLFKNDGDADLIIKDVDPACGCTVASFQSTPIKPGEGSYIETTFDTEGYRGLNIKEIEVRTNGEPTIIKLTLSATVE